MGPLWYITADQSALNGIYIVVFQIKCTETQEPEEQQMIAQIIDHNFHSPSE